MPRSVWSVATNKVSRKVERVDQTMDAIREQMDHANEISEAISNPVGMAGQFDEVS